MPSAAAVFMAICVFVLIVSANACPAKKPPPVDFEFDSNMPEHVNQAVKKMVKKHSDPDPLAKSLFTMLDKCFPNDNVAVIVFDPIVGFQNHAHQSFGDYLYYFRAEQLFNIVIMKGQNRSDEMFRGIEKRIRETNPRPLERDAKKLLLEKIKSLDKDGLIGRAVMGISVIMESNFMHFHATRGKMIKLVGTKGGVILLSG